LVIQNNYHMMHGTYNIKIWSSVILISEQPLCHLHPTPDNKPVLPYHLPWHCYFTWTVLMFYPHLYDSMSRPKLTKRCSTEEDKEEEEEDTSTTYHC